MTTAPETPRDPFTDAVWFKARASSNSVGCVEVAHLGGGAVGLRHSRFPDREPFVYSAHEWACFLDGARNGEFDPVAG